MSVFDMSFQPAYLHLELKKAGRPYDILVMLHHVIKVEGPRGKKQCLLSLSSGEQIEFTGKSASEMSDDIINHCTVQPWGATDDDDPNHEVKNV